MVLKLELKSCADLDIKYYLPWWYKNADPVSNPLEPSR